MVGPPLQWVTSERPTIHKLTPHVHVRLNWSVTPAGSLPASA